jgi:polysaccharide deacetylase family protein (PEP-CTERM system associated)
MTVDVEDYFQVEAFSHQIDRSDWMDFESRIERNVDRLLQQFSDHGARGTFFTLGWTAERYPALIKRIIAAGHELASHGYDHTRVDRQSPDKFRLDVRKTKQILEDLGGVEVRGYRAASFSISNKTPWVFQILADEGYRYSSSIYPIHHDLYPQGLPTPLTRIAKYSRSRSRPSAF